MSPSAKSWPLAEQNISAPAGNIYAGDSEYLVRIAGEFKDLNEIRQLPIRRPGSGLLRISDVAEVELTEQEPRSAYHGNGKPAIALGIIKPEGGNTVAAIERVKAYLPQLAVNYPDIAFEITQDQQPLIDINMRGMLLSIIQAVIFTVVVIFLFLAETRAALVAGISIPLSFLFTLAVLWFTPYTLNMVTLSGLIVATGMVASLVLALTLVPLLASKVLSQKMRKKNIAERVASWVDVGVGFIRRFYVFILKSALRWRVVTLILAAAFFVVTVRTIPPIIGGDLMPPMDTGIAIVEFDLPATDDIGQVKKTLSRVE